MSTRANIVIKEGRQKLTFYKHSDGYPEGTLPILNKFLDLVKSGEIRDNIGQASGWLIVLGREEGEALKKEHPKWNLGGWKVGDIEPTTGIHGDIEFLYTIDLKKQTITVKEVR